MYLPDRHVMDIEKEGDDREVPKSTLRSATCRKQTYFIQMT